MKKSPIFKNLNWRDNVNEIYKEVCKQIWLKMKQQKYPNDVLKYISYAKKCNNDRVFVFLGPGPRPHMSALGPRPLGPQNFIVTVSRNRLVRMG